MIYSGDVLNIYDYIGFFVWNNDKGWKQTMEGPKLLSHCIVFQGSIVWTSIVSLLWIIFIMFFHIMVVQNPNYSNDKKIILLYLIWCDHVKIYLCQKYIHHIIQKNAIILERIKMIFSFHEFFCIY